MASLSELESRSLLGLPADSVSISIYLRTAQNTFMEAQAGHSENELERAYELYYRFVLLVRERIPHHVNFSSTSHGAILKMLERDCQEADAKLSLIRPVLEHRFRQPKRDSESESTTAIESQGTGTQPKETNPQIKPNKLTKQLSNSHINNLVQSTDPPSLPPKPVATPAFLQNLLKPPNSSPPLTSQANSQTADPCISPFPLSRRTSEAIPVLSLSATSSPINIHPSSYIPFLPSSSVTITDIPNGVTDSPSSPCPHLSSFPDLPEAPPPFAPMDIKTPQISDPPCSPPVQIADDTIKQFEARFPDLGILHNHLPMQSTPPIVSTQPLLVTSNFTSNLILDIPSESVSPRMTKYSWNITTSSSIPTISDLVYTNTSSSPPNVLVPDTKRDTPSITESKREIQRQFGCLENGRRLRTLFVPKKLVSAFEQVAAPQTEKNLETCGVLCGTIYRGELYTTHLVIPKHESTPDTCATTNEEELLMYLHNRNLVTFGWIHTHPTQTCFMSSVDLHMHLGYQLMLDEAIAIVLSPRHGEVGVFRLTDPSGLQYISDCRESGFHPHPEHIQLYISADAAKKMNNRGHVVFVDQPVHVKDLR